MTNEDILECRCDVLVTYDDGDDVQTDRYIQSRAVREPDGSLTVHIKGPPNQRHEPLGGVAYAAGAWKRIIHVPTAARIPIQTVDPLHEHELN